MSHVALLIDGIRAARKQTEGLLETIPTADWFRMPSEGVTHVAWQVGHLAMAQYRLALERIRGRRDEDDALISQDFLRQFGRGSVPVADPSAYPTPESIRAVFDRVHQQVLIELESFPDARLDEPLEVPHDRFQTKREALLWCGYHEMTHAGQIALLRRLFGAPPVR